jgi:hypothetical protein
MYISPLSVIMKDPLVQYYLNRQAVVPLMGGTVPFMLSNPSFNVDMV